MRSAGQVSADLPRHVSSWTPAAYEQSRGFHEQETEMEKKDAEYRRRMLVLNQRVADGLPLGPIEYAAWRRWSGLPPSSSSSGKRRKRKKRSKRKLPKSSSGERTRRCVQRSRSRSSFSGAQCSLLLTTGPRCSTSWPVWTRRTRICWLVSLNGPLYLAVSCSLFSLVRLWIHVTSVYNGFCGKLLKMLRFQHNAWFDIHLGDDFFELLVFSAMLGSTVALRDDFVEMVVFSAMLGSASVYWCFWKNLVFLRDGEPGEVASPGLVRTWKSEHYFNKQLL